MATFVLVHGACHGGWCYSRVAAQLRELTHQVYTPTLSGLGERAELAGRAVNLSTHIEDIVSLILSNDLNDIILCGHSYGGMVILGVAGQVGERVRNLFYLDGCVPEDGQSLFDMVGPELTQLYLQEAGDTGTMMRSPGAEAFEVNADDVEWVDQMCTAHPVASFIQKLRYTGKESLVASHTYVRCTRYRSVLLDSTFLKAKSQPGWKVVSLDCGHDPMIDAPAVIATMLLEELER